LPHLRELEKDNRRYVICGDWNIAHKKIDLKNWRSNQKNSGFLPEERAWLDILYDDLGYIDSFREINQEEFMMTWAISTLFEKSTRKSSNILGGLTVAKPG